MPVVVPMVVVVIVTVLARGLEDVPPGGELVGAGPLERVLRLQERGIHGQRAIQIERAQAQHHLDGHLGIDRAVDASRCR